MTWMTSGERLFREIRDRALPSNPSTSDAWLQLRDTFAGVSGSDGFHDYVLGAVAVHALRRLMRYWQDQRPYPPEHTWAKKLGTFIKNNLFTDLDDEQISKLARLAMKAADASDKPISSTTERLVVAEQKPPRCYLCGVVLVRGAGATPTNRLTLEHLWPCSVGGESVEENLLPACEPCQQRKGDAFSWEWPNIHFVVLSATPSPRELGAIRWSTQYALYYLKVMELCERSDLSLKQGFLSVGPLRQLTHRRTGVPLSFFDLQI